MKKNVLTLLIIYFCISNILSQDLSRMNINSLNQNNNATRQGLSKMIISPIIDKDDIAWNVCQDGNLGIIVFYSAIKNLKFEAVYPQTAIVNVKPQNSDNRYILCVKPQEADNFSVKISADGFLPENCVIGSLGAKAKKFFMISPEGNTVEVTVLDKDGYPLQGCRVGIKGTNYEVRGDSRGVYQVELPNSNPATLVVTHRIYEDVKEIFVRPGDNQRVQLYRIKELTFVFKGIETKNNSLVKLYLDDKLIGETNFYQGFQLKYVDMSPGTHKLRVVWTNLEWENTINTTTQTYFIFEHKRKKTGFGYESSLDRVK